MKFSIFVNVVLLIVLADNISGVDPIAKPIIAPIPPRCTHIACPAIKCAPGYVTTKLPTERCPSCRRDCSTVRCARPICVDDQYFTPPGECCPRCQTDCSVVLCAQVECNPGQIAAVKPGQCCPQCQKDCRLVKCAQVLTCPAGQISTIPPGECCARCVPITATPY